MDKREILNEPLHGQVTVATFYAELELCHSDFHSPGSLSLLTSQQLLILYLLLQVFHIYLKSFLLKLQLTFSSLLTKLNLCTGNGCPCTT